MESTETMIQRVRWSPRKFARAYLEGMTLAKCAAFAGSKAVGDHSLREIGSRWARHPRVVALLASVDAELTAAWAFGSKRLLEILRGDPGPDGNPPTNLDQLGAMSIVGRATHKFIALTADVTEAMVLVRGFPTLRATALPPGASLPALPPGPTPT